MASSVRASGVHARGNGLLHRIDDLPAAAVVERDEQDHPGVGGRQPLSPLHAVHELLAQPIASPHEHHPAVVRVQGGYLGVDHLDVQVHEALHLIL